MIDFTIDTRIERSVPEVYAYVTDPAKLATWQTNTVSAVQEGDGPIGTGTVLREVHRAPGGKELRSRVEVSEYVPDRVFALRVIEGTPIHLRVTFEPSGLGTLMHFGVHGQLTGPSRLMQPLLRVALKRQFKRQCDNLKTILEAQSRTA